MGEHVLAMITTHTKRLRKLSDLRRLMHNVSDQQVSQMSQRTTKFAVEVLPAGVGRDLGRKTPQEPSEGLRPVALQEEEVLELVYDSLDDLAISGCPPARLLW